MACKFEVEAVIRGYHLYKEIWDAEVGEKLECQSKQKIVNMTYKI